jgi:hypothetical protein
MEGFPRVLSTTMGITAVKSATLPVINGIFSNIDNHIENSKAICNNNAPITNRALP